MSKANLIPLLDCDATARWLGATHWPMQKSAKGQKQACTSGDAISASRCLADILNFAARPGMRRESQVFPDSEIAIRLTLRLELVELDVDGAVLRGCDRSRKQAR